jgi:hypothetical protein
VILTPSTLSLPHTSTMMMISNMKSDQANFNIDSESRNNPTLTVLTVKKRGKKDTARRSSKNSIYEPLSIN